LLSEETETVRLLRETLTGEKLQQPFPSFRVDEFQEQNRAQNANRRN